MGRWVGGWVAVAKITTTITEKFTVWTLQNNNLQTRHIYIHAFFCFIKKLLQLYLHLCI